jgi:hypothetical protein
MYQSTVTKSTNTLQTIEKAIMMMVVQEMRAGIWDWMRGRLRVKYQGKLDKYLMIMIKQTLISKHLENTAQRRSQITLNLGARPPIDSLKTHPQINYTGLIWIKWSSKNTSQCSKERIVNNPQHLSSPRIWLEARLISIHISILSSKIMRRRRAWMI